MGVLNTILDIVFPTYCISCGKPGPSLCAKCLLESPPAERECAEWIFPLYDYRHQPIKKAVHLLKYKGRKNLASVFADAMYGRIIEELSDLSVMENFKDVVFMPIPLSKTRRRERGFNQSELICKELIKIDKTNLRHSIDVNFAFENDVLIKPKETTHQAHVENRTERLKNIIGSFSVAHPEKIKDRNIILIDDVTTTGATLSEAKKVLKGAGARKIIAFTLAH
jgi:competence protein ComFC